MSLLEALNIKILTSKCDMATKQKINQSQIKNLYIARLKRMFTVIFIVTAYVLIVRGAISFFHPKLGELLLLADYLADKDAMIWLVVHISMPTYDFLTQSIWGNSTTFYTLLLYVFLLAVFFYKKSHHQRLE